MTQHDQTARQAFEIWCSGRHSIKRAENEKFYENDRTDFAWQAWQAALQVAVPVTEGWKLVPIEPDEVMQKVYFNVIDAVADRVAKEPLYGRYSANKDAYRAMIAAAHKPPEPQPPADVSEDERRTLAYVDDMIERFEAGEYHDNEYGLKVFRAIRASLTRAKSDERVVSVEDAKAALSEMNSQDGWFDPSFKTSETIRALLTAAAQDRP